MKAPFLPSLLWQSTALCLPRFKDTSKDNLIHSPSAIDSKCLSSCFLVWQTKEYEVRGSIYTQGTKNLGLLIPLHLLIKNSSS